MVQEKEAEAVSRVVVGVSGCYADKPVERLMMRNDETRLVGKRNKEDQGNSV